MRTLSGRRIKLTRAGTKRDAFYLDGVEVTRDEATHLLMEHYERVLGRKPTLNSLMAIVAWRDCTPADTPVVTGKGKYWHALVKIVGEVK